jgi:hypothetical protein
MFVKSRVNRREEPVISTATVVPLQIWTVAVTPDCAFRDEPSPSLRTALDVIPYA